VRCVRCQHNNEPGAKFCSECDARTAPAIDSPRAEAPDAYTPAHLASKILSARERLTA